MALTDIQKIRIELSDTDPVFQLLSDEEYQYFLEKNEGSIRKTCLDSAKTILFKLASLTFEKVEGLEYRGSDYFIQYKQALQMYLKNQEFGSVANAMAYASGISISDIHQNIDTLDNNYVKVEKSIPTDGNGRLLNNDSAFSDRISNSYFNI